MRKLKAGISILSFALMQSGCATRAVQTEALLAAPGDLPESHELVDIPFIDQTAGYCGPATLTMAMRRAGRDITVDEVASAVYTPGLRGSLQVDLAGASRREGLMAVPIHSLSALLTEIAAENPVIVFENLGMSWAPQWHYALVIGYDLESREIIMHSGHDAFFHWDMEKFERSWMLGDYWGLVVLPAGEMAASADELSQVRAAIGLELAEQDQAAIKSYQKILEKWPTSLVALIGLANIKYKNGAHQEAIGLLERAVEAHPESKAAQRNLSVAKLNSGRSESTSRH